MNATVVRKKPVTPRVEKVILELSVEEAKCLYLLTLNIGGIGKIRDVLRTIERSLGEVFHYSVSKNVNILDNNNYLLNDADNALHVVHEI